MLQKIKILSVLDFSKERKSLGFQTLFNVLDITDPFELDSLIFEAISTGLIQGKLDQKNRVFKILSVKGRDYIADFNVVNSKIDRWIENLEKSEQYIDKQIDGLRGETIAFNENVNKMTAKLVAAATGN
jgi:hypothetical protein